MARTKLRPFSWKDLGLSSAEGQALEAVSLSPEAAALVLDVELPNLVELVAPRDEAGNLQRSIFTEWAHSQVAACFEGASAKNAVDLLLSGTLPGRLIADPGKVLEALAHLLPTGKHGICVDMEKACRTLGLPAPPRPSWRGTLAGAFQRGLLSAKEAPFFAQGHSRAAMKTLEESAEEAATLEIKAREAALEIIAEGAKLAAQNREHAELLLQQAKQRSILDLGEIHFKSSDPLTQVLLDEILQAIRFRLSAKGRYQISVDWSEESIEVVCQKTAERWVLSLEEYQNASETFPTFVHEILREAIGGFSGYETLQELEETWGREVAAALLQHRARAALSRLGVGDALDKQLELWSFPDSET